MQACLYSQRNQIMKILTLVDYYLPGFKGGGPIRTLANMVDWLGDEFAFIILTRDHDLGDDLPYKASGTWQDIAGAQVRYLTPSELSLSQLAKHLNTCDYDVLYLNSFFSTLSVKIMLLHYTRQIPRRPVILAPRGEFNAGALRLKAWKKRGYLLVTAILNLYQSVHWQASSEQEKETIKQVIGQGTRVHIAPDMRPRLPGFTPDFDRYTTPTKVVFLGRVSPMKNLDYALNVLGQVAHEVMFDIYGPIEDAAYWSQCQRLIAGLPSHVHVTHRGTLTPDDVIRTLAGYHLFFLPTRGENFGHVIWEALYASCPVLISDQTPWNALGDAGWSLSLDDPSAFVDVIGQVAGMDSAEFARRSQTAHDYARQTAVDDSVLQANRDLFHQVVQEVR